MNFRPQRSRRGDPSLDLTPLIDVVFLLLIFFLVTASFAQQDRSLVPVDLPDGTSGEAGAVSERATIYLEADGTFSFVANEGEDAVTGLDVRTLRSELEALHATAPDRPLHLRGDREARYGEVMQLLDLARQIGFRRVFNVIERTAP